MVVRGESRKKLFFLVSCEGSTQGCPLAGFSYGILLLALIIQLKSDFPQVKLPWYADDGATAGTLKNILFFFERLRELGLPFEHFLREVRVC